MYGQTPRRSWMGKRLQSCQIIPGVSESVSVTQDTDTKADDREASLVLLEEFEIRACLCHFMTAQFQLNRIILKTS